MLVSPLPGVRCGSNCANAAKLDQSHSSPFLIGFCFIPVAKVIAAGILIIFAFTCAKCCVNEYARKISKYVNFVHVIRPYAAYCLRYMRDHAFF